MQRSLLRVFSAFLATAIAVAPATASSPQANHTRYKFDLPPSAELHYAIKAKESGLTLSGEGRIWWKTDSKTYSAEMETRAMIVGKIHQSKSEGLIDTYGLAPLQFSEKRFRKPENSVVFDRSQNQIRFSLSEQTYLLQGGEQDRTSAIFQLVAIARGNPDRFTENSRWAFFVAGRRDGEPWIFNVGKQETLRTPMGNVDAIHVSKEAPPDAPDRKVDVWLAPSLQWYPVRIRFSDSGTEYIEQTLQSITAQP